MTPARMMELLKSFVEHEKKPYPFAVVNVLGVISRLLTIGFTEDELVHEFGFNAADVEKVKEEQL